MTSQKEAVFNAVTNVFNQNNVRFESGQNANSLMTDELRGQVFNIVVEGFRSGTIAFEDTPANRTKLNDSKELTKYVSGLISNWIRKDPRLNGNTKYVAKNPGSRAGSTDQQLKTLRVLRRQATDAGKIGVLDAAIAKRIEEVRAARVKPVEVTQEQIDALPANIREELGL